MLPNGRSVAFRTFLQVAGAFLDRGNHLASF
jgi:hypothetical protein